MIGRILKFVPRLGSRNVNGVVRLISTSEGDKSLENPNNHEKVNLVQQRKIRKNIRTLTTLNHSIILEDRPIFSETESREFIAIFPDIVHDLTDKARDTHGKEIANWFSKVLQYNVPRGKMNRGLFVVSAYKKLVASKELTEENLKLCRVLGWCSELLQTVLEMSDDIINGKETRYGQPCWHTLEEIGLNAVNDTIMVESAIFILLQKYFGDKDYYVRLMELFREITSTTLAGQTKDLQISRKTVDHFNMQTYKEIVADKGSYYTFYLPVALAMIMADFHDPEAFRQAKTILLEIGHLYHVQEDFLNSFGDSNITDGKLGTDIQKNKCSWLAVVAMQRGNNAQKSLMRDCYGKDDPGKIEKVRQLYIELGIPNTYAIYEEELYNLIKTQIQQTSKGIPHDVFFTILNQIHRRNL